MGEHTSTTQLQAGVSTARQDMAYRSSFRNWDKRASVRVRPRRMLGEPEHGTLYFPPELVPPASHPIVAAHGLHAVEHLLTHRLYQYLRFTSELEVAAVMPVASLLARGRTDVDLPATMRSDAHKIVTDEAWHAQFSFDLLTQVEAHTGLPCRQPAQAQFVEQLDILRDRLRPQIQDLTDITFAIVSETLISAVLAEIPTDRRVATAVREVVRDHAEDEGRHHAYFKGLLQLLWPVLDARQRKVIGPALPDMIFAFLEPDYTATAIALVDIGLSDRDAEQVLVESFPRPAVRVAVRGAATSTIRYLRAEGILDDPQTYDAFADAGLVD
jgi:P-aminobenzoate N-oxygenase AurF